MNIQDKDGMTPLHIATQEGNIECIKLLIEHGAFIHLLNNDKLKPSDIASDEGHEDALHLLLQIETMQFVIDQGDEVEMDGMTIIHKQINENGEKDISSQLHTNTNKNKNKNGATVAADDDKDDDKDDAHVNHKIDHKDFKTINATRRSEHNEKNHYDQNETKITKKNKISEKKSSHHTTNNNSNVTIIQTPIKAMLDLDASIEETQSHEEEDEFDVINLSDGLSPSPSSSSLSSKTVSNTRNEWHHVEPKIGLEDLE